MLYFLQEAVMKHLENRQNEEQRLLEEMLSNVTNHNQYLWAETAPEQEREERLHQLKDAYQSGICSFAFHLTWT